MDLTLTCLSVLRGGEVLGVQLLVELDTAVEEIVVTRELGAEDLTIVSESSPETTNQ